jgi:hypothetical protein
MRVAATAILAVLAASPGPAAAQQAMEYDYIKTPQWLMAQQYVGAVIDACVARRTAPDNGRTLTIGRAITGDDYIFVHNTADLVAPGETKAKGKVWINGKTPYDFSDQQVLDSAMNPGQKYVTIYLANGFINQFAKANSVDVEFANGRSSHPLRGSSNIIGKLDTCLDEGLANERFTAAPAFTAPAGWTAATPAEGHGTRLISIELPLIAGQPPNTKFYMGIVDTGSGRYELRFRTDPSALATRVDLNASDARRIASSVGLRGQAPFSTLAALQGSNTDILDILPADLMKLGGTGFLHLESLDAGTKYKLDIPVLGAMADGPAAMMQASAPKPLSLETLPGKYFVRGRNPNGNYYYGDAETALENGTLRITWSWRNGKSDTGQASLVSNLITAVVPGFADPVLYSIGKDGVWRGTWDKGRATEYLVPKQ